MIEISKGTLDLQVNTNRFRLHKNNVRSLMNSYLPQNIYNNNQCGLFQIEYT